MACWPGQRLPMGYDLNNFYGGSLDYTSYQISKNPLYDHWAAPILTQGLTGI